MNTATKSRIRRGVSHSNDPGLAARELHDALVQPDTRLAVFFASPQYDLVALGSALKEHFQGVNLIGCSTAGEITPDGYLEGALTGVSFAAPDFEVATARIDGLSGFRLEEGVEKAQKLLHDLGALDVGSRSHAGIFGFLLIDGLSTKEEHVVSALRGAIGEIPLFGGSAGDGIDFRKTWVYHDGEFRTDSAVFTLIHTESPFEVFKTEHFVGSDRRMVITRADPVRRVVEEINGEPAGREYARLVGIDVDELTPLIFSAHPVVVKIGDQLYVRSIQKVNDDESLTFFCAIDEGIVLTVAQGVDFVKNLEQAFDRVVAKVGRPEVVLGCDCILRSLELDQKDLKRQVAGILTDMNVVGFSTYGEQYNGMHVNQTFTGVAIGSRR